MAPEPELAVETVTGNPVGGLSSSASISPIAAASAFPASTTMVEVRARLNGAPPTGVIEAGAGTTCGGRVTGWGTGTDAGRQAALASAKVSTRSEEHTSELQSPMYLV